MDAIGSGHADRLDRRAIRGRRRGIVGVLLTAASMVAPASASAAVGWSSPHTLATGKVALLGLAVARNGLTAVAWQGSAGLELATGTPAQLGRGRVVSTQPEAQRLVRRDRVDLAIARTGAAALVWESTPRRGSADPSEAVWVAFRPAGGTWEAPRRLARAGYWPQVAFDQAGNATVTWWSFTRIQAVERPAGGGWTAPVDIGGGGAQPQLAVAADGRAAVVWSARSGIGGALRAGAGAGFGPAQTIAGSASSPGDVYGGARVAFDGSGRAIATWFHNGGREAAVAAPGEAWSAPAADRPAYAAFNGGATEAPPVLDAAGEEYAAWWAGTLDGTRSVVQVARRSAAGAFGAPQTLATAATGLSRPPALAVDEAGDAVVAWQEKRGSAILTRAAPRPAGAPAFAAGVVLGRRAGQLSYSEFGVTVPRVGLDGAGHAVATWQTCTALVRCTIETATASVATVPRLRARAKAVPEASGLRHATLALGATAVLPLVGLDGVWIASAPSDRPGLLASIQRVDLKTNRLVGPSIAFPERTVEAAVGAGAIWAVHYTDPGFTHQEIVGLDPTSGAQVGPAIAMPPERTVANGILSYEPCEPLALRLFDALCPGAPWTPDRHAGVAPGGPVWVLAHTWDFHDGGTALRVDPATGRVLAKAALGFSASAPDVDRGGALWTAGYLQSPAKRTRPDGTVTAVPPSVGRSPGVAVDAHAAWVLGHAARRSNGRTILTKRLQRVDLQSARPVGKQLVLGSVPLDFTLGTNRNVITIGSGSAWIVGPKFGTITRVYLPQR